MRSRSIHQDPSAPLRAAGLLPSLGSVGGPYDNAVVESFWARMQVELLNRRRWNIRVELANAISRTSKDSTTAAADTPPSAGRHP